MNPFFDKEIFERAVFPDRKNQDWRFSDLKGWGAENTRRLMAGGFNEVDSYVASGTAELLDAYGKCFEGFDRVLCADAEMSYSLKGALKIGDFKTMLSEREEEDFLLVARSRGAYGEMFASLASSSGNVSIEAPEGVSGKVLVIWDSSKYPALGLRIKAGRNSNLEICSADFSPMGGLYFKETMLDISEGARVEFSSFAQSASDARIFEMLSADIAANASLNGASVCSGCSSIRKEAALNLLGVGADAHMSFLQNASGKDWHDLRTWQRHKSEGASSRIDVKNIIDQSARASFIGEILVGKVAQKTKAYQSCRTLQLSRNARVDASPILEIEANDVECSHGCAVSGPNKDELFYMACRGLCDKAARALQVEGFARSVLEKISSAEFLNFIYGRL